MATSFMDANGNYFETLSETDAKPGSTVVEKRPSPDHRLVNGSWVYTAPPPRDPQDIAVEKTEAAKRLMDDDPSLKAVARFVYDMWALLEKIDPDAFPAMTLDQFREQLKSRM